MCVNAAVIHFLEEPVRAGERLFWLQFYELRL
jgi:hypothetical protein